MAFKIAASLALKEAAKKCDPVILEPIMKVTIEMPGRAWVIYIIVTSSGTC